jgi:release factor glutamine methyltransferase
VASTISEALIRAKGLLNAQGIESANIDADLLLSHALHLRRIDLIIERDRLLAPGEIDTFTTLVERRLKREPVAYIIGRKEFFGRQFKVNPGVLIPRPETEMLVEQAIALAPQGGKVLEIGVGCGAVIISVLCERKDLLGVGNDISMPALITTRDNARIHDVSERLSLFAGNAFMGLTAPWQLILANPPYVSVDEAMSLDDDVRLYEPGAALFGGKDGLDIVKEIIKDLPGHLTPGGMLVLEVGRGQKEAIDTLVCRIGTLQLRTWVSDLAGIERAVIIERVHG